MGSVHADLTFPAGLGKLIPGRTGYQVEERGATAMT